MRIPRCARRALKQPGQKAREEPGILRRRAGVLHREPREVRQPIRLNMEVDMILVAVADERAVRHDHEAALGVASSHLQILHDLKREPLVRVAVAQR